MSSVGQRERATQNRVVRLFQDHLNYAYLGNWMDRPNNRNIEQGLLTRWLERQGVSEVQEALKPLGGVSMVISALSSKLSSIGAFMAAFEKKWQLCMLLAAMIHRQAWALIFGIGII